LVISNFKFQCLLTLRAHAREGYSSHFVCHSVVLSFIKRSQRRLTYSCSVWSKQKVKSV